MLPADLSVFVQTGPEHFNVPPYYLYNMRPGPYQSIGITEVVLRLPAADADRVLPILDTFAPLVVP